MRAYIPGSLSPQYLEALREVQVEILKSITATDEDAERYRKCDPDWVAEGERVNGAGSKKY